MTAAESARKCRTYNVSLPVLIEPVAAQGIPLDALESALLKGELRPVGAIPKNLMPDYEAGVRAEIERYKRNHEG